MNIPPPPYDEPSAPPEDTKSPITYPNNSNPPLMHQTSITAPAPQYYMNVPYSSNMPVVQPRPMNPYPPPPPSQVYPMMSYGIPPPPMPYMMPVPQQQMIVVNNGNRNSSVVRTPIFKCGYVVKLGGAFGGSWQRRFLCIQPGAVLNYYEDGDIISGKGINFKGLLLLSGAIIEPVLQPVSGRNFCIRIKQTKSGTIDSGPKERWLSCNNQNEVNEWLYHLNLSKSSVPV